MASFGMAQDSTEYVPNKYSVGDTIRPIQIRFPLGEDKFGAYTEETMRPIDSIKNILDAHPTMHIEIACHTDVRGSEERNLEISQGRAFHIKSVLIYEGIAEERLNAVGYGESLPIIKESYINQFKRTDLDKYRMLHQRNRRTLFIITEI